MITCSPYVMPGIKERAKIVLSDYSHVRKSICKLLNIDEREFCSRSQRQEIAEARQMMMKYISETTRMGVGAIGASIVDGRIFDHSTVVGGISHINDVIETHPPTREIYNKLVQYLKITNEQRTRTMAEVRA